MDMCELPGMAKALTLALTRQHNCNSEALVLALPRGLIRFLEGSGTVLTRAACACRPGGRDGCLHRRLQRLRVRGIVL